MSHLTRRSPRFYSVRGVLVPLWQAPIRGYDPGRCQDVAYDGPLRECRALVRALLGTQPMQQRREEVARR